IPCVGFAYNVQKQLVEAGFAEMPGWVVLVVGIVFAGFIGMIFVLIVLGNGNSTTRGLRSGKYMLFRSNITLVLILLATAALHAQEPSALPPPTESNVVRVDTAVLRLDSVRDRVFVVTGVTQRPSIISGPSLRYPDIMRESGIEGRVLVQAIIDTMGRAESGSIRIVNSPHPGFNNAARDYVAHALFRPARLHGRAVRVLVNMPIDFKIRRDAGSNWMPGPP
ncbi:MAG TPA: energy transducer TonB, partial [Gemmatimonadales bacterium]